MALGWSLLMPAQDSPSAFVDENGGLRWTATGGELAQFGVNYTTPFAHAFRAHRRLGVPLERAIDADVYHFARLGLDAYRIHVWDREISDPAGNLVVNDHVRAFDYLMAKLRERGIKSILTPCNSATRLTRRVGCRSMAFPADTASRAASRTGNPGRCRRDIWPSSSVM